jgi:hypothetical protein
MVFEGPSSGTELRSVDWTVALDMERLSDLPECLRATFRVRVRFLKVLEVLQNPL